MRKKEIIFKDLNNHEKNANIINEKELWKIFFSRPRKYYNPYVIEMFNYPNLLFSKDELENLKGKWNEYFENKNDIAIEIGSGSGNFLNKLARDNTQINYIGFEIRFKRLVYSSKKAQNLNNLCFARYQSLELEKIFSKGEISIFYMNFPEPWHNKKYKRLFSEELIDRLNIVLKEKGKIFFKTDDLDYYTHVLNLFNNRKEFDIIYKTEDLYKSDKINYNIVTEFESLFIHKLKQSIKYIEIIKI